MVLKSNSLAVPCAGQSQSRPLSTSRSMVVFTQPTSPKRTNCQIALPRVFRLEVAGTCVLFASPGKGVGVGKSIVGITRKGSLSLIGSKHVGDPVANGQKPTLMDVRLFMILAGSF